MFTLPLGFFGSAGTAHVSEWNTENLGGTGSATKELVLPFPAGPLVDWQDGTVNNLNAHTYAAGGSKTLIIEGDISGWSFNNLGDKEKLTKIVHVGGLAIDTAGAFYGASNMEWTAGFAPKVITTLNSAFRGATVFNGNINNWNVENVTDAEHTFQEAEEYNQPMNTWNTANFTSLFFTFQFALKFNQNVNSWNVGNVTNMIATFSGAIDYNQPLNLWNTGSVTNMAAMFDTSLSFNQEIEVWNVAAVTDMSDMFLDALLFNKNISAWSTGAVLDMSSMFENALAFNKDIDAWNVAAVTNMSRMFAGMLAFKQDLNSWDTGNVTNMAAMFSLNDAFDHVPDWDVSSCLDFSFMFSEANNIVYDGIVTWTLKPAASINMQSCFRANNAMTTPILLVNSGSITNHNSMYSFTMITTFPPYDYTNTTNLGGYCQQADVTIVTACNAPLCTNMFDFVSSCPVTSVSGIVTTSALTTTGFMFSGCTVLASVAVFITSGVTNAQSMFQNTFALPDIPVFDWSSNTNFTNFLSGTSITTASYDDLLVSIDANGLSTGTLDGGSSTFTPAPAAGGVAKDAMLVRSWTITDDGASTVAALLASTNGTTQGFNAGNGASFNSTKLSFGGWTKIETTTDNRFQRLINKYSSSPGERSFGGFYDGNTDNLSAFVSFDGTAESASCVTLSGLSKDTLFHWIYTFDGTDAKLYINGVLDITTNDPGSIAASTEDVLLHTSNFPDQEATADGGFYGIWSEGLTAPQVASLYNVGDAICYDRLETLIPGITTDMISYWHTAAFTGSTGTPIEDRHGANDLTNLGSTLFTGTGLNVEC